MKYITNYEKETAELNKQVLLDGEWTDAIETGEIISIIDFKKRFPDWEINVIGICEPPCIQYLAEINNEVFSIFIAGEKIFQEYNYLSDNPDKPYNKPSDLYYKMLGNKYYFREVVEG